MTHWLPWHSTGLQGSNCWQSLAAQHWPPATQSPLQQIPDWSLAARHGVRFGWLTWSQTRVCGLQVTAWQVTAGQAPHWSCRPHESVKVPQCPWQEGGSGVQQPVAVQTSPWRQQLPWQQKKGAGQRGPGWLSGLSAYSQSVRLQAPIWQERSAQSWQSTSCPQLLATTSQRPMQVVAGGSGVQQPSGRQTSPAWQQAPLQQKRPAWVQAGPGWLSGLFV
jgi:hypothetical protein